MKNSTILLGEEVNERWNYNLIRHWDHDSTDKGLALGVVVTDQQIKASIYFVLSR
jgi:hypothetical protein